MDQTNLAQPKRSRGFTLVEMMVALFIFGIMASASVVLLRQSVEADARSAERLNEMGNLRRFTALASQDFEALVARPSRDALGNMQPAFESDGPDGQLFRFTRIVALIDPAPGMSSVQGVSYRFSDGQLERLVAPIGDGVDFGKAQPISAGWTRVETRFRDAKGVWQDRWEPQQLDEVPVAVEISLYADQSEAEPLVLRFLTGGRL